MNKNEMIKKEIADFIELPAPDIYDLRFSTAEASVRHEGFRDAYEKFFVYKYKKEKKPDCNKVWGYMGENADLVKRKFEDKARNYDSMSDPDSNSKLLQGIYKTIWIDEEKLKKEEKDAMLKSDWIASDAMTSVQGLLKDALKKIIDCDDNNEKIELKKNVKVDNKIQEHIQNVYDGCVKTNKSKKKRDASQECWTVLFDVLVAAELSAAKLDEEFYRLIDHYYPNMREFMNRCFAIGNYCPVSVEFNRARSGGAAIHDYWDLTLMKIKMWYDDNKNSQGDVNNKAIEELLHINNKNSKASKEKIKNCQNWLEHFGYGKKGWQNFVDTLYMQDYVVDSENGNYNVKPFWEGHGWENSKENPGTESLNTTKKMNDALIEISARIAARSVRILNALQENLHN